MNYYWCKSCLVDRFLRIIIYSEWLLYTFLKWCVSLKCTKMQWRIMNKFTIIIREKLNLHVQNCNRDLFKNSVVNMGIRVYNKVSYHIKILDKLKSFKIKLRSFLSCILFS